MENLISRQLLAQVKNENISESVKFFEEAKAKLSVRNKLSTEVSVFLSHKHSDTEIIQQTIALLNKLHVSVYVDWEDYEMPPNTDGSTATRLKRKIKECDKFILLATEDAISSKWCNWELGYGDACKFPKNIAVMPITEQINSKFSGTEYLQIYPIITSAYNYLTGTYFVEYNETKLPLEKWLIRE